VIRLFRNLIPALLGVIGRRFVLHAWTHAEHPALRCRQECQLDDDGMFSSESLWTAANLERKKNPP
jgi:hypothetical protein